MLETHTRQLCDNTMQFFLVNTILWKTNYTCMYEKGSGNHHLMKWFKIRSCQNAIAFFFSFALILTFTHRSCIWKEQQICCCIDFFLDAINLVVWIVSEKSFNNIIFFWKQKASSQCSNPDKYIYVICIH